MRNVTFQNCQVIILNHPVFMRKLSALQNQCLFLKENLTYILTFYFILCDSGDVIGFLLDLEEQEMVFSLNGDALAPERDVFRVAK